MHNLPSRGSRVQSSVTALLEHIVAQEGNIPFAVVSGTYHSPFTEKAATRGSPSSSPSPLR